MMVDDENMNDAEEAGTSKSKGTIKKKSKKVLKKKKKEPKVGLFSAPAAMKLD